MTWSRRCCLALLLLTATFGQLRAQGAWDAVLNIEPYPSPYYSDWDNDPNIASLTVINSTTSAQQVRIHFNVTNHANRIVLSGSSDAQDIGAGATVIFDNPYDVAGTTHRDAEEEDIASRTGRLREGDYTACAVVADLTGFSLAESCAPFTIVYPDPPLLLGPDHGEVLTQQDPLFQWTPVQVPIDFQLSYVMRIAEVLQGQTAAEALRSNIPHFQMLDAQQPSLRYPIDARPFEVGKRYAWTVQVLDQNGYAAATNDGRSEIWTFRFDDDEPVANSGQQTVRVLVMNTDVDDAAESGESTDLATYGSDWDDICREWSNYVDLALKIDVNGKRAFHRRISLNDAILVRDTVPGTYGRRQWAIYGSDPDTDSMMLLSGDCIGWNDAITRRRWVGKRSLSDSEELANWIPTDNPAENPDSLAKLQFGVRIASWFEEDAGKDALPAVKAFLEDHEIELKTGITHFGILDARQTWLWSILDLLPYDDGPAEIELYGFYGANLEVGGEVSLGSKDGVEAGLEAEANLVTLLANMPEHRLPQDSSTLFKTLRVGWELTLGASAEVEKDNLQAKKPGETETSVGGQVAAKLIITLKDRNDVDWSGEFEIPFGVKRSDGDTEYEIEPTITLKSEVKIPKDPHASVAVGHPELELKLTKQLGEGGAGKRAEMEATLKGALLLFDEEIATLAATLGGGGNMTRSRKLVELAEKNVEQSEQALEKAKKTGDAAEIAKQEASLARSKRLLERNKKARADEDALIAEAKKQGKSYQQPMAKDGGIYFKMTLGFGDLSLSKFVDLFQQIRLALTQ